MPAVLVSRPRREILGQRGPSALTSATSPTDYLLRLMFKAARMIRQAGRWFLSLGESEFAFAVFKRHYPNLSTEQRRSHLGYN